MQSLGMKGKPIHSTGHMAEYVQFWYLGAGREGAGQGIPSRNYIPAPKL